MHDENDDEDDDDEEEWLRLSCSGFWCLGDQLKVVIQVKMEEREEDSPMMMMRQCQN